MKYKILLTDAEDISDIEIKDNIIRLEIDENKYEAIISLIDIVTDNPGISIAVKAN